MPKVLKVTAKDPGLEKGKKVREPSSATIEVQTGETAKESIDLFGDEAVLSNSNANWVVTLQGGVRRMLVAGKSQAEIQKEIGGSKMGVSRVRGDSGATTKAKYIAMYKAASPEDKAKLLAELKATG